MPLHANPADHALDAVHTDFISDVELRAKHVADLAIKWFVYASEHPDEHSVKHRGMASWGDEEQKEGSDASEDRSVRRLKIKSSSKSQGSKEKNGVAASISRGWHQTVILMERNMLNYSRNLLAYGVRLGMYCK